MCGFVRKTQLLVKKASLKTQNLKIVLISQLQNSVLSHVRSITCNFRSQGL